MVNNIIGFSFLFFLYFIAVKVAKKRSKKLKNIINVSFLIRVGLTVWNIYIRPLPDSGNAVTFELEAWLRAQNGLMYVISNMSVSSQYFYSDIIAIVYSIFGRNIILVLSINIVVSVLCIVLTYDLVETLWGKEIAERIIWIYAIMASPMIYSSILLREVFVTFFLLLAVRQTLRWAETRNIKQLILAFIYTFSSAAFHASTIFLIIPILVISFKDSVIRLVNGRILIKTAIGSALILTSIVLLINSDIILNKLHFFGNSTILEIISNRFFRPSDPRLLVREDVYFSSMIYMDSLIQILIYFPTRIIEFLFRPFLWEIKGVFDFARIMESFIIFISTLGIIKHHKIILKNNKTQIVLLALIILTIVLASGSHEIAQGHRHKTKIISLFIIMGAPFLSRFTLSKSKRSRL